MRKSTVVAALAIGVGVMIGSMHAQAPGAATERSVLHPQSGNVSPPRLLGRNAHVLSPPSWLSCLN
jgi:hypothetical protein